MKRRRFVRIFPPCVLVLLFVLPACSNEGGELEFADEIPGQYPMSHMDGEVVPNVFIDGDGNELVLAGGELVIRDDGQYFLFISVVVNDIDVSVNTSGTYELDGSTARLDDEHDLVYDGMDVIELTYPIANVDHEFTFDKTFGI